MFAVAGRRDIARIQCIEIIKPQLATLRSLTRLYPYRALETVLTDPRIEHLYGDGRLFIMQSDAKYDLIEADALMPASAYSGNLYSDTYFALLRDHLTPDGVAVSWAPTSRVFDTFVTVVSARAELRRPGVRQQSADCLRRIGDSRAPGGA